MTNLPRQPKTWWVGVWTPKDLLWVAWLIQIGLYLPGAHEDGIHLIIRAKDLVQWHQAVHQPNNKHLITLWNKRRGVNRLSMNHTETESPKNNIDSIDMHNSDHSLWSLSSVMCMTYSPQLGDGYWYNHFRIGQWTYMLVFLEPALNPWSISGIHEQGLKQPNRHGKKKMVTLNWILVV